jgi:protease I
MSETTPATDAGTTKPAGEGIDDAELSKQVAEQTSNDLAVEEVFENEADGTSSETEAAKDPS